MATAKFVSVPLDPPSPWVAEVLGQPVGYCRSVARVLRTGGHVITEQSAAEQAAVLLYLLPFAVHFGADWRVEASDALGRITDAHQAKARSKSHG